MANNISTKTLDRISTVTLPKEWKGRKIFIKRYNDTIVIKKVEKPLSKLSDLASRISSLKMSQKEIKREIQSYRKNK